ncbi:[Pyruvate dehydrogenase (acetyl-transferring)] kinase isozyme 2 [Blastocladiella emersonii ATCC 22665]|nr:[Pyruvate dehydrogenase (acetyl-transferring)] kinase isozyme 2 [Blastocladiella emersonii ATCC 22665]
MTASTLVARATSSLLSSATAPSAAAAHSLERLSLTAFRRARRDTLLAASVAAQRHAQTAGLVRDLAAALPTRPQQAAAAASLRACADRFSHAASVLGQVAPLGTSSDVTAEHRATLAAANSEHAALLAHLEAAWAPVVGTVLADPAELQRLRALLKHVHSSTLGTGLILAEALLPADQHLATHIDPVAVATAAIDEATAWATATFGFSPEVQLKNVSSFQPLYVQRHLHGILVSMLCSALAASVEARAGTDPVAPVKLLIVDGREDLAFKVSDKGPGLSQRQLAQVFNFGLIAAPLAHPRLPPLPFQLDRPHPTRTSSTPLERVAPPPKAYSSPLLSTAVAWFQSLLGGSRSSSSSVPARAESCPVAKPVEIDGPLREPVPVHPVATPAATLPANMPPVCRLLQQHAVSLSLARVHARFFNGDLELISMDNYGSDAYLHLTKKVDDEQ